MRKRNNPVSYLVIAIFFLGLSLIMMYASAADAAPKKIRTATSSSSNSVALKAGECVIITIDNDMYVGKAIHLSSFESFVIVEDVRYPKLIVGLMLPSNRIKRIYTVSEPVN